MTSHPIEAGCTPTPRKDDRHGLFPPALAILTSVAEPVDALSYLALGHVFVANVTGNIVFLGFAFAHAQGFVRWTSALTLVTFTTGVFIGGRIIHYFGANYMRHLLVSMSIQLAFVAATLVGIYLLNQFAPEPLMGGTDTSATARTAQSSLNLPTARHVDLHIILLIVLLAPAMGIQNSTARKLPVSDLPTTVLTMTLTGIIVDTSAHGHEQPKLGRRAIVILALTLGTLTGVMLQTRGHEDVILMVMIVCLIAVIVMMIPHVHFDVRWVTGKHRFIRKRSALGIVDRYRPR